MVDGNHSWNEFIEPPARRNRVQATVVGRMGLRRPEVRSRPLQLGLLLGVVRCSLVYSISVKFAVLAGRKRGRKGFDDAIARGILEMAAATKLRAVAIGKLNSKFSISDCVAALDELPGVNDQVYFAALVLFNFRNARETFLTLNVDKRLIWLRRKCMICILP